MAVKKTIIVAGRVLIALLFATYFAVMLIASFSGDGAASVKLIRGGRGGSQFPIAALPILLGLLVVGVFWLRRVFRRRTPGDRLTSRSSIAFERTP